MTGSSLSMTKNRIESLADNVFSVAMTLLVINLTIPEALRISDTELHMLLLNQWQKFINYFMSFLLLAILWVLHHQQFHFIHKTNSVHLWVNILILMFVVLMPFSTSLIGDYGEKTTARAFFSANMMILALLFHVNWTYATKNHNLVKPDLAVESIRTGTRRSLVFLLVSLAALLFSLTIPKWSSLLYLLIPVVLSMKSFRATSDS
jgi:uncharacterized membrane protein